MKGVFVNKLSDFLSIRVAFTLECATANGRSIRGLHPPLSPGSRSACKPQGATTPQKPPPTPPRPMIGPSHPQTANQPQDDAQNEYQPYTTRIPTAKQNGVYQPLTFKHHDVIISILVVIHAKDSLRMFFFRPTKPSENDD